jgi:hypothetical protein
MSKIIGKQISLANQTFVDNSSLISLPTVAGMPGYTSIQNRAQILDPSKDLSVNMGVSRIPTQQAYEIQNEFGPNGERVWGPLNDDKGLIRFVGNWASPGVTDQNGPYCYTTTTNDYVEVTFYGTGLNILYYQSNTSRDIRVSVDGGSEGSNVYVTGVSPLTGRFYSTNVVASIASGLALGVHTVKIRNNGASMYIYGFEVVNASSQLIINPGAAWISGASAVATSQITDSYNANFTNVYGTAGTRGGHVLVYMTPDGSVKKDVQYTNTASATLTSADHSNEEIARTYYPREFGAGRSDDFSLTTGSTFTGAFTLDDGTTTLAVASAAFASTSQGLLQTNANSATISFTFVGTGLDIVQQDTGSGGSDTYTVQVDGASAINLPTSGNTSPRLVKIVSGLPYGTHTVKWTRSSAVTWNLGIAKFLVYQPKKPALPSGCIELADYNLMASYVASTGAGFTGPWSTGVLAKSPLRELTYVGSWSVQGPTGGTPMGYTTTDSTIGDYFEYTFVGTGIEVYATYSANPTLTVQIDGSAYTGAATVSNGGVWTAGTSTWTMPGVSGGSILQISGLAYGVHKIRVTNQTTSDAFQPAAVAVITPIHSHKSNLWADIQNSLPIGSCSLSDNRKIGSAAVDSTKTKAWAQASGITSNPSTTSQSFVPCPEMSVTVKTNGGRLRISYNVTMGCNGTVATAYFQPFVDGQPTGAQSAAACVNTSNFACAAGTVEVPVSAGVHKIELMWFWSTNTGSVYAGGTYRTLTVEEV